MAVRNYQCRYKIYTKKEIDKIIDDLDIDLTDYYTKSEVDNLIPDMTDYYDKTDVLTAGTGITIDSDNVISASGGGYSFDLPLYDDNGTIKIKGYEVITSLEELVANKDKEIIGVFVANSTYTTIRGVISYPVITQMENYRGSMNSFVPYVRLDSNRITALIFSQPPTPGNTYNSYKIFIVEKDADSNNLIFTSYPTTTSSFTIKYDDMTGTTTHDVGFRFYRRK